VAPAAASAPRMTTAETCTELDHFHRPSTLPGGGNADEREAMRVTMRTLPERASEDLKDTAPAISAFAEVALTDAKNNTRELDTYMADTAVADKYRQAMSLVNSICRPGATG
jgi:hypothetical protein